MKTESYQVQYENFKQSLKTLDMYKLDNAKDLIFRLINDHDRKKFEPLFKSNPVPKCRIISMPNIYQCLDCFYDQSIGLCSDCFDEQNHKNHEIRVLQNTAQLQCGCGNMRKMKYQGMCGQHQYHHQVDVLDDVQIEFIQNLKIILEISAFDALRLIEEVALLTINPTRCLNIEMMEFEIIKKTKDAQNALLLFTRIISYLSKLQQFQQIVVDILLSQIPQELQVLELFRHNHQKFNISTFDLDNGFDEQQICSCSVWKFLLRYFIFVGSDKQNQKNLVCIISNLQRHQQHIEFTRTYIEMIPFQFQRRKQSFRSNISDAHIFKKYFGTTIIQEFCNYQDQIDYLIDLKYLFFQTIGKYTDLTYGLIACLPKIKTKNQAQICYEQMLTKEFNYLEQFIQIMASFAPIMINDKTKIYKYQDLQVDVQDLFKNQLCLIMEAAGQNKQGITQKLIKTIVNKSIETYYYTEIDPDNDHKIIDAHVQSDAIISNLLVYYYLLTDPNDGFQFKKALLQTLDIELEAFNKFFDNFAKRSLEYMTVEIKDFDCHYQFKEAITIYLYIYGAEGYIKLMEFVASFQSSENIYTSIIGLYYSDLFLLPSILYFKQDQNQEIKCLVKQLVNQMYFFAKYLTIDQVMEQLFQYPYEVTKDMVLSQLNLNEESCQLTLKGNPSYNAFLVCEVDQLDQAKSKDEFIIFGNQLDSEMKEDENNTLTKLRKQLIDYIFNGDNQIILYIKDQIEDEENVDNLIFFLNIFITASQHYQLQQSTVDIIKEINDMICKCKIKSSELIIFQKKIKQQQFNKINQQDKKIQQQEDTSKLQDKKNNKLNHYQKLYQNKQQKIDFNIEKQKIEQVDIKFCDVCKLEFKNQPIMRLKYLQFNNNLLYLDYQDKNYLQYLRTESICESEIQLTGCQHLFHYHCYPQRYEMVDDIIFMCQVCKRIGNIIVQVHNVNCDILYYYQQLNRIFLQQENIKYHENITQSDSNYSKILLQIYLYQIRKILEDSNCNFQEVEELNLIVANLNSKVLKSQFLHTINKYTGSIFQIMQMMVQGDFQLNQQLINIITEKQCEFRLQESHSMVNQLNQQYIDRPMYNNFQKFVSQHSNIQELQQLVDMGCHLCGWASFYRCLLCNLNFCQTEEVIKQSCSIKHSTICHNSKLCLIGLFTGTGYIVYNECIGKYPKLLYKNILGEQYKTYEEEKRNQYIVNRKTINEFFEIQISDRHINYFLK